MVYNGSTYYYILNQQGDVIRIVDDLGGTQATYLYNAWGKLIDCSGWLATTNPIRYRGYYYDNETGFYYLQSRYYDPAIGRFINADSIASTGQGYLGYNMFAYCNNNPCCYSDASGKAFVGLGAQFDVSVGAYECGVEAIVYWDETVCDGGDPVVAIYVYEGASISIGDILKSSEYIKVVGKLTAAMLANAGQDYETAELVALQASLYDTNVSASVVAIWGYDDFRTSNDYEGKFTSYSGNYQHAKVSYAYSETCWAISVGATTDVSPGISYGETYYTQIYTNRPKPNSKPSCSNWRNSYIM